MKRAMSRLCCSRIYAKREGEVELPRRYLVIVQGSAAEPGKPVQVQAP